ncbi:MAG: hypothetical protein Q7S84_04425 [bacterium]|nr:hypothetical protein [bacterium]
MRKSWIVAASMGYGHLRAALPLLPIAQGGELVIANDYPGIPAHDRRVWAESEQFYNFVSRFREAGGAAGRALFGLFNRFQAIHPLAPGVNESGVSWQLRLLQGQIRGGLGRDLIERLVKKPLPLVTTFPMVGFSAEVWGYPEPVYVVVTDSDISRAWAPVDATHTQLRYFASTDMAARHLTSYGVPLDRIAVTGFPLPQSLTDTAAESFTARLDRLSGRSGEPVTILFSVGGAGAQSQIGRELVASLAPLIRRGEVRLVLSAGANPHVAEEFRAVIRDVGVADSTGISVLSGSTKLEYFRAFEAALARMDLLWTKPSELSFYAALGIPIIMAPPVGSQEERNRAWLRDIGAGLDELNPTRAHEWVPEHIRNGTFAEAARRGYERMEREGARRIMEAVAAG